MLHRQHLLNHTQLGHDDDGSGSPLTIQTDDEAGGRWCCFLRSVGNVFVSLPSIYPNLQFLLLLFKLL